MPYSTSSLPNIYHQQPGSMDPSLLHMEQSNSIDSGQEHADGPNFGVVPITDASSSYNCNVTTFAPYGTLGQDNIQDSTWLEQSCSTAALTGSEGIRSVLPLSSETCTTTDNLPNVALEAAAQPWFCTFQGPGGPSHASFNATHGALELSCSLKLLSLDEAREAMPSPREPWKKFDMHSLLKLCVRDALPELIPELIPLISIRFAKVFVTDMLVTIAQMTHIYQPDCDCELEDTYKESLQVAIRELLMKVLPSSQGLTLDLPERRMRCAFDALQAELLILQQPLPVIVAEIARDRRCVRAVRCIISGLDKFSHSRAEVLGSWGWDEFLHIQPKPSNPSNPAQHQQAQFTAPEDNVGIAPQALHFDSNSAASGEFTESRTDWHSRGHSARAHSNTSQHRQREDIGFAKGAGERPRKNREGAAAGVDDGAGEKMACLNHPLAFVET